jgi:hypothetical protein
MALKTSPAHFKRRFPRRYFDRAVGVLFRGQYEITASVSLGEGGIAFVWPEKMPINQMLAVTFRIPEESLFCIRAEIKNAKPNEQKPGTFIIGIQFATLPIFERRRIRGYVSSRADNEPII